MTEANESLFELINNATIKDEDNMMSVPVTPPFDLNLLLQSGPLYFSYGEKIIMLCVIVFLLVVCATGNTMTLFFIIRDERLHTPILTAIACHAFADLMIGVIWFGQALYTLGVGNTDHFKNYKVACFIERSIKVFWALGQTQNLSVMAIERFLYFSYPYWYIRLISVRKILVVETSIYALAFIYIILNILIGDSYYSVSLLHCSVYNVPWYFPMLISVWIIPPSVVVIVMVVMLSLLIRKQRHQIQAQQTQVSARQTQASAQQTQVQLPLNVNLPKKPEQLKQAQRQPTRITQAKKPGEALEQVKIYISGVEKTQTEDAQQSTSRTSAVTTNETQDNITQAKPVNDSERDIDLEGQMGSNTCNNSRISGNDLPTRDDRPKSPEQTTSIPNKSVSAGNPTQMIKTAIKLVGCISLSFYLTWIPGVIVTLKVLGDVPIVDLELGRYPGQYHLFRIFYFFAITISAVINPFFHFWFNRPLKRGLYKMLHRPIPTDWTDSTTQ